MTPWRWGQRSTEADQRGSASVELAVLAVPCVILLALLATGFRVADAQHRVTGVAGAAAREASLGRDARNAEALAEKKAKQELSAKTMHCSPKPQVNATFVDTWDASGRPGMVTVTVSCSVPFADLGIPLLRGSRTLTDVAVSPIDPYRAEKRPGTGGGQG